jgi:hypothetical protein
MVQSSQERLGDDAAPARSGRRCRTMLSYSSIANVTPAVACRIGGLRSRQSGIQAVIQVHYANCGCGRLSLFLFVLDLPPSIAHLIKTLYDVLNVGIQA